MAEKRGKSRKTNDARISKKARKAQNTQSDSVYGQRPQVRYVKKKAISNRKFITTNRMKLVIVFSVLVALMLALIIRLNYINLTSGETYAKRVLAQQQYTGQTIPFRRGDIVDRNGTVLATSEKVYNLVVDAYVINHAKVKQEGDCVEPTLEALDKYFGSSGVNIDEVRQFIKDNPNSRYNVVIKHLPYDTVKTYQDKMAETDKKGNLTEGLYVSLSGVWFEEEYIRKYPYGTLACDLIGFTNSGDVGAYGIEAYYNDTLNGTDGRDYGYMTENSVVEKNTISPINGYTVVSTIDINIQQIIEKHLHEFNEAYGSKNSAVIVQDVETGEILGMASYPYFNLNSPNDIEQYISDERWDEMSDEEKIKARQAIWRNFCVSDAYEAGSTVKTLTMAMGLEENLINEDTTFNCNGYVSFADGNNTIEIACTHVHGTLDLKSALAQSCNAAFMTIGDTVGPTTFRKYQRMFGLGQKTNVDLPGETSGLLYTDSMSEIDLVTNAFGQNYTVNMLQVSTAFSSIVNSGSYYRPHVVKEIQSENGSVIQSISKELVRTTVSEQTTQTILSALEQTVTSGTGTRAAVDGYRIGGKTGTAEKYDENGNRANSINLVSFLSTAPVDNPKVVVYVLLDEPDVTDQANGSKLAANMTGRIYKELLPYMQIFPEGQTTTTPTDTTTDDSMISESDTTDSSDTISAETDGTAPEEATESESVSETKLSSQELKDLILDYDMTPQKREHVRE